MTTESVVLYVCAHPSQEERATGYAAGLANCEDDIEYEVIISDLCPPDKLFVLSKLPDKMVLS